MTVSEVRDDGSVHCIWFALDLRQEADFAPAVIKAPSIDTND